MTTSTPAPVRREVRVAASADTAFRLFTRDIGAWWPIERHSVFGGTVAFEGDRLVERSFDAEGHPTDTVWAEVTEWRPPHSLRLDWHPGTDTATDVRVTFTEDGSHTIVSLVHQGWERLEAPEAAAEDYGNGWPGVLALFAEAVDPRPAEPDDARWFALLHRTGPAVPAGSSFFDSPGFALHSEFLSRLQKRGWLVLAGPLADEPGAGMTIVRLGSEHDAVDIEALASEEDASVASGFLTVTVRPWRVVMGSPAT
jgi:uncharacterized protein YciI